MPVSNLSVALPIAGQFWRPHHFQGIIFWFGMLFIGLNGCRVTDLDSARRVAKVATFGTRPLVKVERQKARRTSGPLRRWAQGHPRPSDRTSLYLRKYNLSEQYERQPEFVVRSLCQLSRTEPSMESVHAIAELAQLEADWKLQSNQKNQAAKYYATSVIHAYQFLFDPALDIQRNAYDPQFRRICDIYNQSLENLLRLICSSHSLKEGTSQFLGDHKLGVELQVVVEGRWKQEEFERFELVNDFKISGIDNSYHTYGLGVPLIAIRKPSSEFASPFEKYYPPSLALPMTAFCEVLEFNPNNETSYLKAVLRLYDPLERTMVHTESQIAPLESNLTVPLAYYLNDPLLKTEVLSTVSLLDANVAADYFGLYMLEPFDKDKIPVVMVHGLWSSPVTFMKMFNDLQANPQIRQHYQFWFYMYPTGQPFWITAHQMRLDLEEMRRDVDPHSDSKALQAIVLVGHSMGGLVSRMQTVNSHHEFWEIVSTVPVERLRGNPEMLRRVQQLFYFEADPTIRRVITIATPHQGSRYANNMTRWLSNQIFRLPKLLTNDYHEFVRDNKSALKNTKHLTIPTSVDSLSSQSPFIQKLYLAEPSPHVQYHNIYGRLPRKRYLNAVKKTEPGDGVVSVESARFPATTSELEIPAEHMEVHQHPECILEVHRILIEALNITQALNAD